MASDLRVPPGVTQAFEEKATQICNDAKLDFDEWPLRAYEAVTHLQERWRKGIRIGLGTDEAERQALNSYGEPSVVARSWRKAWHKRMLFHQRYRPDRFFLFLVAYVFFSWLAVLDVHFRAYMDGKDVDLPQVMLPFNSRAFDQNEKYPPLAQIVSSLRLEFFVDGLGTFFVGLAALASVVTIQWRPNFKNPLLNQIFVSRYLLWVVALFAVGMLTIRPVYLAWDTFKHYEGYLFYQGYCLLHIGGIFLGWFGAACLISEFLDFPEMMRKRRDHNRPFAVVA
jgi:hypothetical protein